MLLHRSQVQRRVMQRFRNMESLNLLFATRVGAEGLDFGCCGLVVLFDLPNHVQEYLQCRWESRFLLAWVEICSRVWILQVLMAHVCCFRQSNLKYVLCVLISTGGVAGWRARCACTCTKTLTVVGVLTSSRSE